MKRIAIIDYGVGNLYSIKKALDFFGINSYITEDPGQLISADALILPGVGSFQAGMEGLKLRGLSAPIKKYAKNGKPILGICLGAQILFDEGYEFGKFKGLGIIPGKVVPFPKIESPIPHIGWNEIYKPRLETKSNKSKVWTNTILESVPEKSDVYFVHSYILAPDKKEDILSLTKYGGYEFCSAMHRKNVYGCQYHPEKSGKIGLEIIKNFINII